VSHRWPVSRLRLDILLPIAVGIQAAGPVWKPLNRYIETALSACRKSPLLFHDLPLRRQAIFTSDVCNPFRDLFSPLYRCHSLRFFLLIHFRPLFLAMGSAAAAIEEMETLFDDHPSLAGSMDDFDPDIRSEHSLPSPAAGHPVFGIPSTHSGFRADMYSSGSSEMPQPQFAPWRRSGTGFYANNPPSVSSSGAHHSRFSLSRSMSRESSPMHGTEDDPDTTLAADVPLPASPLKRTPAPSVEPEAHQSNSIDNTLEQPTPGSDDPLQNCKSCQLVLRYLRD
jgi:hypothetical protein